MTAPGTISRKQGLALVALLTYGSITEAAQQCGVAEATFYRWLKDAAFQAAYREARRHVVQHAMTQLQRATGDAVETLRHVMQNSESPASARGAAAKAVLETAVKAVELEDLEARIAALETHMKETPR